MGTFEANLATFLQWLLKTSLQGSLLVCLIMLIKGILRERLPARWHYCLWLVLLIRLALPWAPPSRISIYGLAPRSFSSHHATSDFAVPPLKEARLRPDATVRGSNAARTSAAGQTGTSQPGQGGTAAGPSAMQPPLKTPASSKEQSSPASGQGHRLASFVARELAWVWLAGGAALAGYILIRAFGLWRAVASERPVTDQQVLDLLEDCKMQMRVRTLVAVVVTDKVRTPALFGVIRPRILLPQGLIGTFGLDELHCVFLHELAHLKRRDIYLAWLVCLLQVLHWFNPLMWYAFRRMRADQEMAADALALATAGADEFRRYGQTIVSLLERFSRPQYLPSLAGILENPSHIERRIQMIAKFNRTSREPWLAIVLLVVLGLIALTDAQTKSQSDKPVSVIPQAAAPGAAEKAPPGGTSDTIVDPKTGFRFAVVQKIAGENDEIIRSERPSLSPNRKFLLCRGQVIPLDGSRAFKLEALTGAEPYAAWSPDGKLIAYRSGESGIWVLPLAPETGQPTGPARKLADDNAQWKLYAMDWTDDSQQIRLYYRDNYYGLTQVSCLSVPDSGKPVPSPERPRVGMDYTRFGLRSRDGQWVAFSRSQGSFDSAWVASSAGGPPEFAGWLEPWQVPLWWSPDGQWLLYGPDSVSLNPTGIGQKFAWLFEFVRPADRFVFDFVAPDSVGENLGLSPDGRRLLFYKNSYAWQTVVKMATVRNEPAAGPTMPTPNLNNYLRCPDGKRWCYLGPNTQGDRALMVVPVTGGEPLEVKIYVSQGDLVPDACVVSPDGKRLFFEVVRGEPDHWVNDAYVIDLSLDRAETIGAPVLVFKDWEPVSPVTWLPDCTRLIVKTRVSGKRDLWVVPVDGSSPKQLTQSPKEDELSPMLSPDGNFIAYCIASTITGQVSLCIVPSEGGTPKAIWTESTGTYWLYFVWFPDSREIGVLSGDEVVAVSIGGGKTRPFLKLADAGLGSLRWFGWSPDGQKLGLYGGKDGKNYHLALFHASDNRIEKLYNDPVQAGGFSWTPDSQTIAYCGASLRKVRPAGAIYGLDLEEALRKAAAGAPPVQDKPPAATLDLTAPPLVNGEYTDHFDDSLTSCWKVVEQENQTTHVHEVQNGEFVLENGAAILGEYSWTNYVFKVRMCIKSPLYPGLPGVVFRRNVKGAYYLEVAPHYGALGFGILFGVPANERHAHAAYGAARDRAFAVDTWYTIEVEVKGSQIKASVDGQPAFEVDDATFPQGAIELRAERCRVHFDDFRVRLLP